MSSTSRAAAQDAAVDTDTDRGRRKAHAAVEYHRREVAAAEQGAKGATAKAEKFRDLSAAAEKDRSNAEFELDSAKERLAAAQATVDNMGGDQ